MRFDYDAEARALLIAFSDGLVARTEELDAGTLVDVDERGEVVALEILQPARRWPVEDFLSRYVVADEDRQVLESLWESSKTLPFSSESALATA